MLNYLTKLSSVRLYVPKDLRSSDSRYSVRKSIEAVQKKFPDGLPLLDPCKDMKIKHEEFKVSNVRRILVKTDHTQNFIHGHGLQGFHVRLVSPHFRDLNVCSCCTYVAELFLCGVR